MGEGGNMGEGAVQRIHIDLDRTHQVALTGIRRVAIFMGLGLNAARNEAFKDYELTKLAPGYAEGDVMGITYGLVPDGAPAEKVAQFKEEFGYWVTSNGLRDLVETFAAYLDQIHSIALLVTHAAGRVLPNHEHLQAAFHRHPGLGWKLEMLRERFGITLEKPHLLESLYAARNCLSHRLGVVAEKHDCGDDGSLKVKWVGADVSLVGVKSGKTHPLVFGEPTPEECDIVVGFSERTLSFREGERIRIPHEALTEVCFYSVTAAGQLIRSLADYIGKCGYVVRQPAQKGQ